MSQADFARWMALYAATSLCCAIAFALSVGRTLYLAKERQMLPQRTDLKGWFLFGPRLWWQWQKVYLTTTPVTLGIIGLFALSMDWSN